MKRIKEETRINLSSNFTSITTSYAVIGNLFYIIPEDGIYCFFSKLLTRDSSSDTNYSSMQVNGIEEDYCTVGITASNVDTPHILKSRTRFFKAGDKIELKHRTSTDSGTEFVFSTGSYLDVRRYK